MCSLSLSLFMRRYKCIRTFQLSQDSSRVCERVIPRKLVANKIMRKKRPNIMALSNPITIFWLNRAVEAYTHLPSFQQQYVQQQKAVGSVSLPLHYSSTRQITLLLFSLDVCVFVCACLVCVSIVWLTCVWYAYQYTYITTIDTNVQTYKHRTNTHTQREHQART